MLIPLGILAASGAGFIDAYEHIATANGTGSSDQIFFNSIPQDYKHLQIRYTARNSSAGLAASMHMNSVTASVYARHDLFATGTGLSSNGSANRNRLEGVVIATPSVSSVAAAGIIDILDYSDSSKNTTVRMFNGRYENNTNRSVALRSGLYNQTTPVTSLRIFTDNAGNFTNISRFSLYGIKG
jgi:hypothetical protein